MPSGKPRSNFLSRQTGDVAISPASVRTVKLAVLALLAIFLTAISSPFARAIESGEPLRKVTAEATLGDFDMMVERRQIRVLIPYSKTFFFLDGGRLKGVAVELLRDFEKKLNATVRDKSKRIFVFLVPTPRDQLLNDLVAGKGDIAIGNLTVTPERVERVDFTEPLLTGVRELIVTPFGTGDLTKLEDLSGLSVTVRRSSSYLASLERVNETLSAKGLAPVVMKEADPRLEDEDLLEMVQVEMLAATVVDSHKLELWTKVYTNLKVHEGAPLREDGRIAWAIRKNSPRLAEVINRYVAESQKGTERGNIVYAQYVKSDQWLKKANSPENLSRLAGLLSLFRKYGEMYDIDPFLMAAIAFQESRFDQRLVMRTGATGIMQMMPATARDPNVALPNITNLEVNVHAFAKYFRFMRQRYVNQEGVSEFDRLMLLLASYNAGPERLKKLRAKAANPNVWHESVEWAVWKSVGLETVQYVRNVHRYYIAFKDMSEALALRGKLMKEAQGK